MYWTIFIVFFLLMTKWIILFILFIPIRILQKKKRTFTTNSKHQYEESENIKQSTPIKSVNIFQKVKNLIYIYLEGYIRYIIINIGNIPSMRVRLFFYKKLLYCNIMPKAIIYYGAELRAPENLYIGQGSIIGDKAILDARFGIEIGENVNLSTGVWIWTAQHDYNSSDFSCDGKCGPVKIGNRVWIGPRTMIMPGITIGEGAVIAGGAIVTKDVDPFTLVAGIPAKQIGKRNHQLEYNFYGEHIPFY